MKEIDETRNYFIEVIKQNKLINKKHKNVCNILSYTEHLLILASAVTECVPNSAFTSLVSIPADIRSFAVGTEIFAIIAIIKKYK